MATETKTKTDSALKALQSAAKGLTFMSESDRAVKAFLWKRDGKTEETTIASALQREGKVPDGANVKTLSIDAFFAPVVKGQDWFGDEEKALAKRFQELVATLKEHLTDVQAFRVEKEGDAVIDAYVIGRTPDGNFAGVQTQLVET